MMQFSKTQIALTFAAAIASFIAVGQIIHPGRALPLSAATVGGLLPSSVRMSFSPAPASHLDTQPADHRAGLRAACQQDVQKLCGTIASGHGRIVRCLAERRSEVSEACASAMMQERAERVARRQAMQQTPGLAGSERGSRAHDESSGGADGMRFARRMQMNQGMGGEPQRDA
jgi:Cysteine rich repeat